MFVALIILHLMNGSILMERQSDERFLGAQACGAWIESSKPGISKLIADAQLPVMVEARCDRES